MDGQTLALAGNHQERQMRRPIPYIASVLSSVRAAQTIAPQPCAEEEILTIGRKILTDGSAKEAVTYFERVLARGVAVEHIFESTLPTIAADLGCAWDDDRLSFADLSIAFSSLQIVMHTLRDRYVGQVAVPGKGRLVIASLAGEPHLFGAIQIAARLERIGFSVSLLGGATPAELSKVATTGRHCAIGLSCGSAAAHAVLDAAITSIRQTSSTPIIVGGAITGHREARDLAERVDLWGPDWTTLQDFLERRAAFQLQNVN
jgi:methanogenic corrinoid protein MtbC1